MQTVDAICTAAIHVLLSDGANRLTTSRVAERAGVSVGSLYQYFPNKQSLLAAVLERHLLAVVEAVEAACRRARDRPVASMAEELVQAFFEAKFADPDCSRALYAVASEVQGEAVVARLTQRSQLALCEMLATAADRRFDDLAPISFVVSTALIGPVQALLASDAPPDAVARVRAQLTLLVAAYLASAGRR